MTGESKGLACQIRSEGSPPLMRLAYQFQGQKVEVKVTRPINGDTHRAPYLPNGKAYGLQTLYTMEDDDLHQPQAP